MSHPKLMNSKHLYASDPISRTQEAWKDSRDYVKYQILWHENYSNMVTAHFVNSSGKKVKKKTNLLHLEKLDKDWLTRDKNKPYGWEPFRGHGKAAESVRYLKHAIKLMKAACAELTNEHWEVIEASFRSGYGSSLSSGDIIKPGGQAMQDRQGKGRKEGSGNEMKPWQRHLKAIHKKEPNMKPEKQFLSLRAFDYIEHNKGNFFMWKGKDKSIAKENIMRTLRNYWKTLE